MFGFDDDDDFNALAARDAMSKMSIEDPEGYRAAQETRTHAFPADVLGFASRLRRARGQDAERRRIGRAIGIGADTGELASAGRAVAVTANQLEELFAPSRPRTSQPVRRSGGETSWFSRHPFATAGIAATAVGAVVALIVHHMHHRRGAP